MIQSCIMAAECGQSPRLLFHGFPLRAGHMGCLILKSHWLFLVSFHHTQFLREENKDQEGVEEEDQVLIMAVASAAET